MTKPGEIRDLLRVITEIDYEAGKQLGLRDELAVTPWMPFPLFDFIALTAEALADSTGDRFLEIGCGPGTKMLIAQELFGLDVMGVERADEYAQWGRNLGLTIFTADALGWEGYGGCDILWFNRPFRDRQRQRELESQVWHEVRPGAVVMCANLESPPPSDWILILDDWEIRRGIWRKP